MTNFYGRWAQSKNVTVEYKLVSMINHVGPSPNCGHYTSIAEAPNGMFYVILSRLFCVK